MSSFAAVQVGGVGDVADGADIGADLRPHNITDMLAFLNLSSFLIDLLPQCGAEDFAR